MYSWHTHSFQSSPIYTIYTHSHPGTGQPHHHNDCWLVNALGGQRLHVGSANGPRLAGEVTPIETLLAAHVVDPEEVEEVVAELIEMAGQLGEQ